MQTDDLGKESNFEKWKILKLMTYESREEKRLAPRREKDRKRPDEREGGKTLW